MTSLWVFLLGSQYAEKDIKIPYHLIAASLAMFVIPLALGSWFKQKWPAKAEVVRQKLAKPFFAIILIIVPVTGTLTNLYYFKLVTWRHLLAGLFLGGAGYCLGAALAFLCRQGESKKNQCHNQPLHEPPPFVPARFLDPPVVPPETLIAQ